MARSRTTNKRTIEPEDLVDMVEIARRAGKSKPTVRQWKSRLTPEAVGEANAFPPSFAVLAIGEVWIWSDVEKWLNRPRVVTLPPRMNKKKATTRRAVAS